ncbi:Uncharacterized conserved protein YkwD, contains CAP (CSP/antigen 5/PR1) domain [Sphingomonas sp. YR710]|uniref:CAP domain-containing protein n=1 Tax=Sphingomonas sp. YR710 TaxID=1882773 RepID=UPI00088CCAE2|nr:CAP domain-containing protein [Sphingomonas sp. YR710]SDD60591.1 Uncharacterized conserved protein YkwD, contains CAP (CSP/antigen 5/PR1) domain [Sphingomonas sp. YR710]
MPHRLSLPFLAVSVLVAPQTAIAQSRDTEVLDEINYARTHPQDYADELRQYRDMFEGRIAYLPGEPDGRTTREGVRAVDEAIAFLERQPPLPPLDPADLLAQAAADQADDQGRSGRIGHVGSGGRTIGQRVQRRGGGIYVSETISYGYSDPRDVVRQLIVDDGVATRGHRAILFASWLRYAGVGCGQHPVYTYMCVVDFSQTQDGRPIAPLSHDADERYDPRAGGTGASPR